jgi:DNA-binding GntR family transcriptional regulator
MATHVAADRRFHVLLVSLARNDEITQIVAALRARHRRQGLRTMSKHSILLHTAHQHLEMVELVRSMQPDASAALLERHIRLVGSAWGQLDPVNLTR